jgi:uncharacterized membrane protein
MKTQMISIIATLVALSIATSYALIGLANVTAMDFIVFIGGFCFGPIVGALIGILTWAVYGAINPYGFVPQIWLATMFSEPIYGVVGGLVGKNLSSTDFNGQRLKLSVFFGIMGFALTFVYEFVLNVVSAFVFYDGAIILAIIAAVPFTFSHEISNIAIFTLGSIPMITAIEKIMGVKRFGFSAK